MEVDAASMAKDFESKWIMKFTKQAGALRAEFYLHGYYNVPFLTVDDGVVGNHAPENGVIVCEGSKEAKDIAVKINNFVREKKRQKELQTPAGKTRLPPMDWVTPSPSDAGTRKRKHNNDSDDKSDNGSDDESDVDPDDLLDDESEDESEDGPEIDPAVAEKIADNILKLIKAQLVDDQSTAMPSITLQYLASIRPRSLHDQ